MALRSYAAACLLLMMSSFAVAQDDEIEAARKAASEWVRVRGETSRLEAEWRSQQPLLESTVAGLVQRAETLKAKRDFLEASHAEETAQLEDLEANNAAQMAAFEQGETQLRALAERLVRLQPFLPPVLSSGLDKLYLSVTDPEIVLADRARFTFALLNRCIEFDRTIHCGPELLQIDPQSGPRLHEAIYWGLSHGYALDRQRQKVWFGSPGERGWHWEELSDAADRVARLIAIYQGDHDPAFVEVPARLSQVESARTADAVEP